MNRILTAIVCLFLVVGLLCLPSCVKSPPSGSNASTQEKTARPADDRETWDVYLLKGKRIGYGSTSVCRKTEAGRDVVVTESLNHLAVKRAGQTTEQDIRSSSVESSEGQLLRFQSEMRMGPNPIRTTGRVQGKQLILDVAGAGTAAATQTTIPWPDGCLGPFATEQTLSRQPMQPGERRTLKTLMIGFNQVADVEMTAKEFEPTTLLNGIYDLLRIETITRLPDGQKIEGTVWSDRTGDTLKTYSQAMGLETYRVSKAEALEKADTAELDLLAGSMVKVERPLANAHQTKRIRYRVHLEGGDPASVFITGPSQAVKSIDAHTAEVTVYAIRPGKADGNANAPADLPTDADRQPNRFIESDDPLIVADAKKVVGDETDPWRMAVALERYVNGEVKDKNFSQAFASAAEVAKSREGDCTEHAVFLAALCRACGIPARVAVGLVYMQGTGAFGYHMWTEVYIDKRWIPIDGTLAQGGIGAGHLEIAHSNLKGASAYSAFLPVVQILGRLGVEIVDVQ